MVLRLLAFTPLMTGLKCSALLVGTGGCGSGREEVVSSVVEEGAETGGLKVATGEVRVGVVEVEAVELGVEAEAVVVEAVAGKVEAELETGVEVTE